ncbi:MAG: hypothetical protein MHM6MM_001925 [Cercozoa sp. M6MM]
MRNVASCRLLQVESRAAGDEVITYSIVMIGEDGSAWRVWRRYSAFESLRQTLKQHSPNVRVPRLPPKTPKLLVAHGNVDVYVSISVSTSMYVHMVCVYACMRLCLRSMSMPMCTPADSPHLLQERLVLLDNFITRSLAMPTLKSLPAFTAFLTDGGELLENEEADAHLPPLERPIEFPKTQEITDVRIPSVRHVGDHVIYRIDVSNANKRQSFGQWTVLKRYTQFFAMDEKLRADFRLDVEFLQTMPQLPPRRPKMLSDHMDSEFIEQRRALLEAYLRCMLRVRRIASNATFLEFLGVH